LFGDLADARTPPRQRNRRPDVGVRRSPSAAPTKPTRAEPNRAQAGAEGEHVTVVAREQSADGRAQGVELLWERLDEADP
jgi:hypothetical protein